MADNDSENASDWIEKVKSTGSISHLEPDNCPNGWATPSGDIFNVRGPDYLSTKVKIPGGEYLLKPLGFEWIKGTSKICQVLNNPNGRVRKALDEECAKDSEPFVWAFNLKWRTHRKSYCIYEHDNGKKSPNLQIHLNAPV